jgi:hypothetical protein
MIVCGLIALRRESDGRPIHLASSLWIGLIAGALVIIASFTWNYRALLAGAPPEHFYWTLFLASLPAGVGSFAHAWLNGHDWAGLFERRGRDEHR